MAEPVMLSCADGRRVGASAAAPAACRAASDSAVVVSVSHGGTGGPTSTASWLTGLGGGPESAVAGVRGSGLATGAGGTGLETVELVTGAAGGGSCGGTTGDLGPRETGALTVELVVGPTWAA
ncbi:MAG: hypothetical protein ACRD0C_24240 [Acidimicrobiia bacterium]